MKTGVRAKTGVRVHFFPESKRSTADESKKCTLTPVLTPVLLALAFAFVSLAAFAQDKSAETFLRSIYGKAYIGKNAKGVDIDTRARLDRYFTPELARRIDDDATIAAKHGDVGELDGDAFIGAQDFAIAAFDVSIQTTDATHATGIVRFTNLGDARTIIVTLVRLKPGWRIADIDWGGQAGKLSALFAKPK